MTLPHVLTLGGEIQNILLLLNRDKAIDIPIYNEVGRAGGTVIVIKSSPSDTNSHVVISPLDQASNLLLRVHANPKTAIIAITPTNFIASL